MLLHKKPQLKIKVLVAIIRGFCQKGQLAVIPSLLAMWSHDLSKYCNHVI